MALGNLRCCMFEHPEGICLFLALSLFLSLSWFSIWFLCSLLLSHASYRGTTAKDLWITPPPYLLSGCLPFLCEPAILCVQKDLCVSHLLTEHHHYTFVPPKFAHIIRFTLNMSPLRPSTSCDSAPSWPTQRIQVASHSYRDAWSPKQLHVICCWCLIVNTFRIYWSVHFHLLGSPIS